MSDLEKANYEKDELSKKLAESERHGKIVENCSKITEKLGADNLPVGLVSVFGEGVLADDDGLEEAYKNVSKVFGDFLQQAIDKRIADSSMTPLAGGSSNNKLVGGSATDELNQFQQSISKV